MSPSCFDLLDGSLIYDEYKGDFGAARKKAESALESATGSGDIAAAALDLAAIQTLQGDCEGALFNCRRARDLAQGNATLLLRATAIDMWSASTRWNLFPDGSGSDAVEAWLQWPEVPDSGEKDGTQTWIERKGLEYAGAKDSEWVSLEGSVPDGSHRLQSMMIYQVLSKLSAGRAALQKASSPEALEHTFTNAVHPVMYVLQRPGFKETFPRMEPGFSILLADLAFRAQRYKFADDLIGSAAGAYNRAGDRGGIGCCYLRAGDFRSGPLYSPLSSHLPISESPSADSSDVRVELYQQADKRNRALVEDCYTKAAEEFRFAGVVRGLAAVDLRRACLEASDDRYEQARDLVDSAIRRFSECGDQLGALLAKTHGLLIDIGRHSALADIDTARQIGEWGRTGSYSYALGLGLMLGRTGRLWLVRRTDAERALACFRLSRALFEGLGAPLNVAQSIADHGVAQASFGNHTAAAVSFEEALWSYLDQARQRSDSLRPVLIQKVTSGLSLLYAAYEKVADPDGIEYAAARVRQFVRDAELEGFDPGESFGEPIRQQLERWQHISRTLDVSAEALEAATKGSLDASAYADSWQLAWILETGLVTAACYRAKRCARAGDKAGSEEHFDKALRLASESVVASRHQLEGIVYAHRRDYDKAVEALHRHWLGSGPSDLAKAVADAMAQSGADAAASVRHLRHEIEQRGTVLLRLRRYDEAKQHFQFLKAAFGENWWRMERDSTWDVLLTMAEVEEYTGDLHSALQLYTQAIDELEQKRRTFQQDNHRLAFAAQPVASTAFLDTARAALKVWEQHSGKAEEALGAAGLALLCVQANHARSLAMLLAETQPGHADVVQRSELNARLSTWRSLLAHFRQKGVNRLVSDGHSGPEAPGMIGRRLSEDEAALHRLEYLAVKRGSTVAPAPAPDEAERLDAYVEAIPDGTALIQYAFRGEDLMMWAVNKQGIIHAHRTSIGEFEVDLAVRELRTLWVRGEPSNAGDALSARLLKPLAAAIDAHDTLTIVPYGETHRLPFHALPWRGEPLLATHTVTTLPVASALAELQNRPESAASGLFSAGVNEAQRFSPTAAGMGMPLEGFQRDLVELPFSEFEARVVASLADSSSRPLLGREVTRNSVVNAIPKVRIVHLATHAVLIGAAPLLSSLVLSNGDSISAMDLSALRLDADLVVLSACESAIGEITNGNDVLGMTRILMAAGARGALVSLWPVRDISTLLLMKRFYELLGEGATIAGALRSAQLWLRNLNGQEASDAADELHGFAAGPELAQMMTFQQGWRRKPSPGPFAKPYRWAPFTFVGASQARVLAKRRGPVN